MYSKSFFFWILILLLVFLRILFSYTNRRVYPDGTKIKISGRVMNEPIIYDSSQRVTLESYKFYLPLYPEVVYGDVLVVEGVVEGTKLNRVKVVSHKESAGLLFRLRKKLLDFYERSLPIQQSGLISGVTIGSKKNISSAFWEVLRKSGTAHVVVASGMNVTLVAGFLMSFLVTFLPRRRAIPLALAGVWGYALVSGFDAPIVRAAIMGSIAFSSQQVGRLYLAWRALVISALVMLLINPVWINDLGFILSFVATASLMLFERRVDRMVRFVRPAFIRKDLSSTLAAQIGVAPILLVSFGQFNPFSVVINTLVLWTVVPMTLIGMFAGIVGLVVEPLGRLSLYLVYPMGAWFIFVIETFT